jgi:hypothetical protein
MQISPCAAVANPQPFQLGDGVGNTFRTTVSHVIARQGHRVKAGVCERGQMFGESPWSGYIRSQFSPASGVRYFQVSDAQLCCAQAWRNATQPIIRVWFIQDQITTEQ